MLSPGIVLQQRYRIKRLLARGGMGAVYEAEAVHLLNVTIAVKETFFGFKGKELRDNPETADYSNEIDDLDRLLDASFKLADGILCRLDRIQPPPASN